MNYFRTGSLLFCLTVLGRVAAPTVACAQTTPEEYDLYRRLGIAPPTLKIQMPQRNTLERHLRIGALVGFNLKAEFSINGSFAVSGVNPGATGVSEVAHVYDDGYVLPDAGAGQGNGSTYNWGYQSAGQYDSGANRLTFHATKSFSTSGGASVNADPQIGFDTAYGGDLFLFRNAAIGWEFGFGFMPISIKDKQSLNATAIRTVHYYDTTGTPLFPDAPYNGGFNGPGTVLNDIATAGPDEIGASGKLTGTRSLDVTLYNFRLGPTVQWELHPRVAVAVSAGAALGILTGELKYDEVLTIGNVGGAANSGKTSSTKITYGGYLAGMFLIHIVPNGDYYLAAQFMPLSSATFKGGGREAKLDLTGGVYISTGINWPF